MMVSEMREWGSLAVTPGRFGIPATVRLVALTVGMLISLSLIIGPVTPVEARGAHSESAIAGTFVVLSPTRIGDTRTGSGFSDAGGTLGTGGTVNIEISGGNVPQSAVSAAVLNVTVVGPTAATFISVYPEGAVRPGVANMNVAPGQTESNLVTVQLGTQGGISIYNHSGSTDLVVDLEGYYSTNAQGEGLYNPVNPVRLLGTLQSGATVGPGVSVPVNVTGGTTGVPADASAVVANITAAGSTVSSYLTTFPTQTGVTQDPPMVATLNFSPGQVIGNRVTVAVGANGQIEIYNHSGSVNVDVDLYGYYTGSAGELGSAFTPLVPTRLIDTRSGMNGSQIGSASSETFTFTSNGIPTNATALASNVTAVAGAGSGYLTIFPVSDTSPPAVGDINFGANDIAGNFAVAPLNSGSTKVSNSSAEPVNIVIDAFGFFAPPPPAVHLVAIPPGLPADGMSTSDITVTVTTGSGVAFDDPVTLTTAPSVAGSCGIASAAGSTNAYGQVTSTYTASVTTGSCTISATEANGGTMGSVVITQAPT